MNFPHSPRQTRGAAPPASPWPVFLIASLSVFLVSLDTTVLYAAFGAIQAGFPDSNTADLSWVLNAYTVVYAALLVPAGRLADLHGRKRIFLIGVSLFLLSSLLCGLAVNVPMLIAARVLQAIGAALLTPASLALVLGAFPLEKRAVAVSLWGAVGALAAALGPSLGSLLIDTLGWRWAFFINLPVAAVSLWRGALRLQESRNPDNGAPLDLPGVALLILGVGGIAFGLVRAETQVWTSASVVAGVAGGIAALLAFVAWARRARHPAIDLDLFDSRSYRYVNLATLSFGTAFAMMFFGFFLFLTQVWHYSLPLAGLAITPGPLMVVPVAILSGRFAARAGHKALLVAGNLTYALAGAWFLFVIDGTPDYLVEWLPASLLTGLSVGLVLPSLSAAAVARLPATRLGVGSAVNQAVRQIGAVMGVALTILLLGHAGLTIADFQPFYLTHIGLSLLTALLCLAVETRPPTRPVTGAALVSAGSSK